MSSVCVNVGHRNYDYKCINPRYVANPIPLIVPTVKKYGALSIVLAVGGVALAYLVLDPSIIEAASPYIDTAPIDKLTGILYDALVKVALYIATPLLAWSGITLATSGTNVGKRTAAKQIIQWTAIGLGLIVGAPWLATMIFKIWNGIF